MRGRKPRGMELKPEDVPKLEALVQCGKTEQRTARRARVLLGVHRGERVKPLSERVEQDPSTIWRVCRRYEERGIEAVYDARRSGRPPEISPPRAGAG
jgi:transposase